MNNFSATGRVGGDPSVRYTNDGKAVASFSIAVDSGYGQNKMTSWVKVTLFDKRASVSEYIKKGHLIGVSGELQLSSWTDKQGAEQKTLEMINPSITLIGRVAKEEAADAAPQPSKPRPRPAGAPPPVQDPFAEGNDPFGDDVPF